MEETLKTKTSLCELHLVRKHIKTDIHRCNKAGKNFLTFKGEKEKFWLCQECITDVVDTFGWEPEREE